MSVATWVPRRFGEYDHIERALDSDFESLEWFGVSARPTSNTLPQMQPVLVVHVRSRCKVAGARARSAESGEARKGGEGEAAVAAHIPRWLHSERLGPSTSNTPSTLELELEIGTSCQKVEACPRSVESCSPQSTRPAKLGRGEQVVVI